MAKMTGLGKGLDALFANNVPQEEQPREGEIVKSLKLIEIEPNKEQARKKFNEESLEELAESIKKYGLIQPIVVTKKDNFYEIIAGERRWRASKKAGLTEIPAIIRDNDERKNKEISLIENIQREDLNPIDKAKGLKALMEEYGLKQQEVADIIGKNRSTVANTIRILNLDQRILDLVAEGKLTEGHCKSLLGLQDPEQQYKMALRIIDSGETCKSIEDMAKKKKKMNKIDEKYEAIFKDIENNFRDFFGTKVKLDAKKNKGKIIIEYNSNDDLSRIIDLLK